MNPHVDRLLGHLGVVREAPSLAYLHRLVRQHQTRVPFETFTKLIDYEPGRARGDFLPPFDLYVERIVTRGAGGLCWTLARGFQTVLTDLGFHANFMVMDPGHLCVRVELPEGSYYADVGYAAPLFQAYPLNESFRLETEREMFDYHVGDDGIVVTRDPGPTKKLDPTPRTLDSLHELITGANDWSVPTSFLHRLSYTGFARDGIWTSVRNGTQLRFVAGGPAKTELAPDEVPAAIADWFGADPELVHEGLAVHARCAPAPAA